MIFPPAFISDSWSRLAQFLHHRECAGACHRFRRHPPGHSFEPLEARIAPAFSAVINLADLTGADGFKISGLGDGDSAGFSVSDAGDVNGDGVADLIVGAFLAN